MVANMDANTKKIGGHELRKLPSRFPVTRAH